MKEIENYLNNSPTLFFKWQHNDEMDCLPTVSYATQNVNQLFNASAEDFISGKVRYEELLHPEDADRVIKELASSIDAGHDSYTHTPYRIKNARGWKWVDDRTHIIRNEEGKVVEFHGYITDLTPVRTLENELIKSNAINELMHNALDMNYLVSKSDLSGVITYVNNKLCQVSGYSQKELIGKPHSIFRHPSTSALVYKEMWKSILNKKVWNGVMKNQKKDGSVFHIDATIVPVTAEDGEIIEFIAIRHEITQLIQEQEEHKKSLKTSPMFNLPNRASLLEDIQQNETMVSALINIDSFHEINDFYGYDIGDQVLKSFALAINEQLEYGCRLYHLQSDQFVIYNGSASKELFEMKMREIQLKIEKQTFTIDEREISLSLTVVISNEHPTINLRTLDMSMECAKQSNEPFAVYSQSHDRFSAYKDNLLWLGKLKSAFDEKRIVPYYQPLYNYQTGKIERFESLARLVDEEGDIVPPGLFLDAAKKAKMMTKLSVQMVENTFEYFKDLKYGFSMNITVSDMLNSDFVDFLLAKIASFPQADRITLEILESEEIEDYNTITDFISSVKGYGCKIAIDDFGSGYANFENLLKLDADFIKLDGSLIRDIHVNTDAYDIVEAIVGFARKKKIQTVAEFVSNQDIFECVNRLGIDYAQGYFIGMPSPTHSNDFKITRHPKNNTYKLLLYVSQSTTQTSFDEGLALLNSSWLKNKEKGLTGILLYEDFHFIQAIEGRPDVVDALFEKITLDKRHTELKIIGTQFSERRIFSEWNMGRIRNEVIIDKYFNACGLTRGDGLYKGDLTQFLKLFDSLSGVI